MKPFQRPLELMTFLSGGIIFGTDRLALSAVAAAGVAYVFSLSDVYSFGFLMGAVAALPTWVILIAIFLMKVALSR